MKKNKLKFSIISFILLISVVINFTGCSTKVNAEKLSDGITARSVAGVSDLTKDSDKITEFAVNLFKGSYDGKKDTLVSPLSVFAALAMTANGANGNTLSEMESVLGVSNNELNEYFYSYMKALSSDGNGSLSLANSIWFKDDGSVEVKKDFLQKNADYFNADIFKAPFDSVTLKDINNWVNNKTNGMIKNILDDISPETVMCLINALSFEAEWMDIYEKERVKDGDFTLEDNSKKRMRFMYSNENLYLKDENASGFIKRYKGGRYAFAALLPDEGVSISEYISSLDGSKLNALLSNPVSTSTVYTSIPKFETEYDIEMSNVLRAMGMKDAFDAEKADFTGIGTSKNGNLYISRILHKTFISVAEKGTKAGAATLVDLKCGSAFMEEIKEVYLNRPFVYMLIDLETNIPFFIGVFTGV